MYDILFDYTLYIIYGYNVYCTHVKFVAGSQGVCTHLIDIPKCIMFLSCTVKKKKKLWNFGVLK